ncbi:MAG: exo-alpha-sialidase [Planctomycetaceae bacterium]|nr:exo-alpha-sialidase [Planctomycetaceae bacterium]
MRLSAFAVLMLLLAPLSANAQEEAIHHTVVYQQEGEFAGWPANYGIWSWGDEIVVGFVVGYHKINPRGGHDIDPDKPSVPRQARSLDGGETWNVEIPNYLDEEGKEADPTKLTEAVDFSDPNVALRFKGGVWHYSLDRCHTWKGPFELPSFDRPNLQARTDYLIEGPKRVTAFIAASKSETPQEGQPACIRTADGGLTWDLVGWIGPEPPKDYGYAIMPATVRVGEQGYLSMIRRGGVFDGKRRWWVEPYLSPDDGKSWYLLDSPVIENSGNPATLTRLENGAIALAYGMRRSPYGIRVQHSEDDGQTWSRVTSIRSDGSSWDIGYPRTVQRADGKCVTVYYYHNSESPQRYIACTIWDPEKME